MKFPTPEEVEAAKAKYLGKKIRIIKMDGEPRYAGKEGICDHVDDSCQLHGSWGGLALQPENDTFEIVE